MAIGSNKLSEAQAGRWLLQADGSRRLESAADPCCCPDVAGTGACCISGTCFDGPQGQGVTAAECQALNGFFRGVGSSCPLPCVGGACCYPGGECTDINLPNAQTLCTNSGGTYQGDGSLCANANIDCPQTQTGGCCVPNPNDCENDQCTVVTQQGCQDLGGVFLGSGTDCTGSPCPVLCNCPDCPSVFTVAFQMTQTVGSCIGIPSFTVPVVNPASGCEWAGQCGDTTTPGSSCGTCTNCSVSAGITGCTPSATEGDFARANCELTQINLVTLGSGPQTGCPVWEVRGSATWSRQAAGVCLCACSASITAEAPPAPICNPPDTCLAARATCCPSGPYLVTSITNGYTGTIG